MEEKQKKSKKKIIIIGIVVAVIVIIIAFSMCGKNGDNQQPAQTSSATVTSSKTDANTSYNIGDEISTDNGKVKVVSVEKNAYNSNPSYKPADGKEFIKVTVSLENTTTKEVTYNPYDWHVKDSQGVINDINAGIQFTEKGTISNTKLAAGGKTSGDLYFEVPKDDAGLIVQYTTNMITKKNIEIKISN